MPSFANALKYWFKLGWISFGGPAGQIAMMHDELVERRRWISDSRFTHALNYCVVLPGPEAQQLATYIGWLMHGVRGGIAAGVLFVLPSLFILLALAWVYTQYGQLPVISGVLAAVKPAIVAIILAAAWRIGSRTLRHPSLWAISIAAFIAVDVLKVPFPWIILAAAAMGTILARFFPAISGGGAHASGKRADTGVSYLIDEHHEPPPHARFRLASSAVTLVMFVLLWASVLGLLYLLFGGWLTTAVQLAWFHTKAALLTFGGAYAVLPYVHQSAVNHYQWLSSAQMIDGLALGESTPGPLIMVVTFVGYLAGWHQGLGLAASLQPAAATLTAGVLGGVIATFFTFLPSFLFILAGAPFIEGARHQVRLKAPLNGITAAVVGVIASLGVFLGIHVLYDATTSSPNLIAIAIAVVALLLQIRFKFSTVRTIALAAVTGLALSLLPPQ